MKFTEFSYRVNAEVILSHADVMRLVELSQSHYDATCRAASQLGGFIYGWSQFTKEDWSTYATVSSREADLICKILEQDPTSSLAKNFGALLRQIHEESRRLNRQ